MSLEALPKVTFPFTVKLSVTVKSDPIVTSSGKASLTVTSVPDLATLVEISLAVPTILKSSVNKAASPVPESPSTVNAVAIDTVEAAVN